MIEERLDKEFLKDYASKHDIYKLSSEDIIKLMMNPYIISEIAEAFGISEKEFNLIRKQKGVSNLYLEDAIRNIEIILNQIDFKNRYVSNKIRKKIVDVLIPIMVVGLPKHEFYIEKLSEINFSRELVMNDLINKNVDQEYRLKKLDCVVAKVNEVAEILLSEEKDYLFNYNNRRIYNKLYNDKKNGKKFVKADLTYDILYELSIIECISDSTIGEIYNMSKSQVKYLRSKNGLSNTIRTKREDYPEYLIYIMESEGRRPENISNYEIEKLLNIEVKDNNLNNSIETSDSIVINVDGEDITYNVNFSSDKYSVNKSVSNRKNKGSHHNHKKEDETKRMHGKIGEKLACQAERMRLIKLGLKDLVDDVNLVAQIDENITFDGLGYDLISFNEFRERICIEVKTCYGKKDRPFFISKNEIELMQGLKEEYDCKHCLIYYVLVDGNNVTIKNINTYDFSNMKLTPVLYRVE